MSMNTPNTNKNKNFKKLLTWFHMSMKRSILIWNSYSYRQQHIHRDPTEPHDVLLQKTRKPEQQQSKNVNNLSYLLREYSYCCSAWSSLLFSCKETASTFDAIKDSAATTSSYDSQSPFHCNFKHVILICTSRTPSADKSRTWTWWTSIADCDADFRVVWCWVLFWAYLDISYRLGINGHGIWLFTFGNNKLLPVLIVGVAALAIPFLQYRGDLNTVYVVTDRRVITIEGKGSSFTIRSFLPKDFTDIIRQEHQDGTGDVIFFQEVLRDSNRQKILLQGFLGVQNAREIEAMLRTLKQEVSTNTITRASNALSAEN
jgi:hypothetical protein